MAFKYTYTDPNQIIKATFPFAGSVKYYMIGGGGGGGGNDTAAGTTGRNGTYCSGSFNVTAGSSIVLQPGGGGRGGNSGNDAGGGAGGIGIIRGGAGGASGYGGSSGSGGGGGAASFIISLLAYQDLISGIFPSNVDMAFIGNNLANNIGIAIAGGGGGGGGNGRYGLGSADTSDYAYSNLRVGLASIEGLYGQNGYRHYGDGGGGGGGGGGFDAFRSTTNTVTGGGKGGASGGGDSTGYSGGTGDSRQNASTSRQESRSRSYVESVIGPNTFGIGGTAYASGTNGVVSIEYTPVNQDEYDIYSKMDGAFKKATGVYVRANSGTTWQQVKEAYVKQSGSWVRVLRVIDPNTYAPILQNVSSTIKGPLNKGADLGWVTVTGVPEWTGNTTMNSYAIANESVNKLGSHEFTTTVFIPEAGNYRIIAASDNVGYVTANCNRCSTVDSFQTAPGYKSFLVNLPRGEIYLTIGYENTGGPGGIAAVIQKLDGTQMWNTRAWQNGTYSFTYNVIDAGIIGSDVCVSLTEVTPEA